MPIERSRDFEVSILLFTDMNRGLRVALATTLLCAAAACALGPSKTPAQRDADNELAGRVQAALSADKVLYSRHINVRADNGAVTLSGYVWTTEELQQAREDAESVPGVAKVVDRMEVDRGGVQDSNVTR